MYYLKEEPHSNLQESDTEEEDENETSSQDNSVFSKNKEPSLDYSGLLTTTNGAKGTYGIFGIANGIHKKKMLLKEAACKLL